VAYITELLGSRSCAGCQIIRAESRGQFWDSKGNHVSRVRFTFPMIVDYDVIPVGSGAVMIFYSGNKWYDSWSGSSTSQNCKR
jgi:hypothetical protein